MIPSAPSALARASLSSPLEVTMTFAPIAFASCSAKTLTPPVPIASTVSPGCRRPSAASPTHAVSPAHGRVAASSNESVSGTSLSSQPPARPLPRGRRRWSRRASPPGRGVGRPLDPAWEERAHHPLPTSRCSTREPTSSTSPAPSERGMKRVPHRHSTVEDVEVATVQLTAHGTRTCPGPGRGEGRSTKTRFSRPRPRNS